MCDADWLSVPVFAFAVLSGTTLDVIGCNTAAITLFPGTLLTDLCTTHYD